MSYLEVHEVSRAFGAVQALRTASMTAEKGSIHGLCGANGAGKSTLIRILAGATRPDSGQIVLDGSPVRDFTPQHATERGIGVVHQELALVPELSIYKNIFLGIEQRRGPLPRSKSMKQQAREILAQMGISLDPGTRVSELGLHHQQIVEIAKALCRGTRLLILDEPTAILNIEEKQRLFAIMRELRRGGLCIIFITHFIDELFEVCDRVTVMRDGRTVRSCDTDSTSRDEVISAMVGEIRKRAPTSGSAGPARKPVLGMHGGTVHRKFADVTLEVHEGEILGLAGLIGSGCNEVAETLFGLRQLERGEIRLEGGVIRLPTPRAAVEAGIGYVPEDRRKRGLCLNLPAATNLALPALGRIPFSWNGIVRRRKIRDRFLTLGRKLELHPLDPAMESGNFSGGGQQKLVIGKWIESGCRAYVLAEPTRGVDVRAKVEIWRIIEELSRDGTGVVFVSTDFDDIAALCSRCLVFAGGQVAGELSKPNITMQAIANLAITSAPSGPRSASSGPPPAENGR